MSHPLLTRVDGRWIERGALASGVLLLIIALWLLLRIVLTLWPRGDIAADVPPARLPDGAGTMPSVSVSRWHLFGAGAQAPGNRVAPATALSLALRGTVAKHDPTGGVAVIGNGDNERAYRVGDAIEADVTLLEVHPDHVVISRDGHRESLRLPRDRASSAPPAAAAPASMSAPMIPSAAVTPGQSGDSAPLFVPPQLPAGSINWEQTLEQVRNNPTQFTRLAQPVLQDGKLLGLRVRGLDAATMARIGLEASDLVTHVNGIAIDSPARAAEILGSVQNAQSAKVTVMRNGQPVELTVSKP